jgi:tetratricopeptide (TPR) repeat protein
MTCPADGPDALEARWHASRSPADLAALVAALRRHVEVCPQDWAAHLRLGRALYAAEAIDEAIVVLQKAKQDAASAGDAGYLLGQCFVRKRIFKLALQELQAARAGLLEGDETRKDITYLIARIFEQAGKKREAVEEYEKIAPPRDDDEPAAAVPARR